MKKWRRRGGIGRVVVGLSGCTLEDLGGSTGLVSWTWTLPDPDEFRLSFSTDGGTNWEIIGPPFAAGADRTAVVDAAGSEGLDYFVRIEARVGGVTTSTCFTNVVVFPL